MANSKREYIGRGQEIASEDLDDLTFARVVARRARMLGRKLRDLRAEEVEAAAEAVPEVRGAVGDAETKRRKDQERSIEQYYEKVHEEADFLPARFLQDGANLVPAVCRMRVLTPDGKRYTGTGFLVAPGFIMTNNHVLETREWAAASQAIFHFQEGQSQLRVALEPERFFMTDRDLDFTIVGCDAGPVDHIAPVRLLQNAALITRHDRVYIIQHPAGRPKEVVLRNNDVLRVRDRVVHYRADTEGGSSGSPVFNEDWQLVALHHAGWREGGDKAVNEGVSIPAIIRYLQGSRGGESAGERGVERILDTIEDSSPFLGFFDHRSSHEVSVDSFSGNSDYADIGFWNIEHFNRRIDNSRVATVADVVSRLSLDAFGLTEVERGALDRLVGHLERSGDSYGYVYHNAPGSQDIAILYDRDTTVAEKLDDIYQRHREKLEARTPSGKTAFPREPLFAQCIVQERAEDDPVEFVMVVLHLKAYVTDPPSRERRALAAQMLAEIVDDIRERLALPVILGGDYNELITTDVLAPLRDSPDLFALTTDDARDGGISYIGRRHRSLIDHIIVSDDVPLGRIQGDDAAIVRLDRTVADFADDASDHVPLVMRMVYRDDPTDEDPEDETVVDIPDGAEKVRLAFE